MADFNYGKPLSALDDAAATLFHKDQDALPPDRPRQAWIEISEPLKAYWRNKAYLQVVNARDMTNA